LNALKRIKIGGTATYKYQTKYLGLMHRWRYTFITDKDFIDKEFLYIRDFTDKDIVFFTNNAIFTDKAITHVL